MTRQIKINFNKPDDFNITSSKATGENLTITHKDYYYKNEITVISNGKTYTYDTPNASAIFFMGLSVILFLILTIQSILKIRSNKLKYDKIKYQDNY